MRDGASLSPSQRDVLEWMLAYPSVEITWLPMERARWTSWWASEEARQHMGGVLRDLAGPGYEVPRPRQDPRGGTPHLTTPTFEALLRRGLVARTRYRPAGGHWSPLSWYQISRAGVDAIRKSGQSRGSSPT